MAKRPELMVMTGELSGKRFPVPEGGLRLGRSSSNDLHITDEELSRNHCMFETEGDAAIRVVDLASANGTYVNGEQLGSDPRTLKVGDLVEVGSTKLSVVAEGASAPALPAADGTVDLGLGTPAATEAPQAAAEGSPSKRPAIANLLWVGVAGAVIAAIAIVLCIPSKPASKADVEPAAVTAAPKLSSLVYEKVAADATHIFRYEMTVDAEGTLRIVLADVPGENRHVDKAAKLDERAAARIAEIFGAKGWDELEETYSGPSASSENELKSWRIRTVFGTKVREVLVENTSEPEAFQEVREALETFANNELGTWATQYSKDQLLELSASSEKVGDAKWEEREVRYGNVSEAVKSYREAVFYLETVSPKPEGYASLKERLAAAEEELDRRYREQRFLADKAINLGDWETACSELRVLCEIVPEKTDERHAEANAKLVDVERRLTTKKGGK